VPEAVIPQPLADQEYVPAGIPVNPIRLLSQLNLLEWVCPPKVKDIEEQLASRQINKVDAAFAGELKINRPEIMANMTIKDIFLNIVNTSVIFNIQHIQHQIISRTRKSAPVHPLNLAG
jgi:hypothetical protein